MYAFKGSKQLSLYSYLSRTLMSLVCHCLVQREHQILSFQYMLNYYSFFQSHSGLPAWAHNVLGLDMTTVKLTLRLFTMKLWTELLDAQRTVGSIRPQLEVKVGK